MRRLRSTSIEWAVAAFGLLLGAAVGLWLASQTYKTWQPTTILASTRARVVGQGHSTLGRTLETVGRTGLVIRWYVERAGPLARSQPLLVLGIVLIVLGLFAHTTMGRLARRHELESSDAQRRGARTLARSPHAARPRHLKASGLGG